MKKVKLTAKARVEYAMTLDISDDDYAEYQRLVGLFDHEPTYKVEQKLEMWAGGLGLLDPENISDIRDYEGVTLEDVTD